MHLQSGLETCQLQQLSMNCNMNVLQAAKIYSNAARNVPVAYSSLEEENKKKTGVNYSRFFLIQKSSGIRFGYQIHP